MANVRGAVSRGVSPRSQARRFAALALYQWDLTQEEPAAIRRHMLDDPQWLDALAASLNGAEDDAPPEPKRRFRFNQELFEELIKGVPGRVAEIDAALARVLDRPIAHVDPVELAILRLGTYEILFSPGTPSRVAINEAVELTKFLGAQEGHRYVNGVLDKIARSRAPG